MMKVRHVRRPDRGIEKDAHGCRTLASMKPFPQERTSRHIQACIAHWMHNGLGRVVLICQKHEERDDQI